MTTKQRRRSKDGEAKTAKHRGSRKVFVLHRYYWDGGSGGSGWDGLGVDMGWIGLDGMDWDWMDGLEVGMGWDGYVRRFLFYRNPQHTSVVHGGIYFR